MSYRPHKRKRATCLKGKCIEYIGDNLHKVFEAGVLDIKLREQILEYLCETPMLVELPDGFLDEAWTRICFGGCILPKGLLAQVGEQCYDLEELDLKQCAGNEMLDVESFAALCDGCRQLKTMDLTGIMTLKDKQLECMHHLGSSLRRVRLGGNICLSPSAIATFLQKAGKNLQELDLSGCQVNDEVLQAIATHCRNLQELSLGYADKAESQTSAEAAGVSHFGWPLLLRNLKKVHTLRLKRVVGTGRPLLLLIARHLGPNLRGLDITGCKEVKSDEMVFLLRSCPNLEYLCVKNCTQLLPDFLDLTVAKLMPKLKTLERDRASFDVTRISNEREEEARQKAAQKTL